MKHRSFVCAAVLLVSTLAGAAERPNIVVVMVDDMGVSDIGPYGGEIETPHLDAMAAAGAKFSQFYNTGRCCPTRASLLTGLYSHQAGIGHMTRDQQRPGYRGQLTVRCVTIAEVLGDAGYFTAMTGKWHVGFHNGVTPSKRGFDRDLHMEVGGLHYSNQTGMKGKMKTYLNGSQIARDDPRLDPPWYGADLWTDYGLRFVDEAIAAGRPFFWYLAHAAPHFPCMAPEPTIAKYRGRYRKGWDKLREERHRRQIASGFVDPSWGLTPRPEAIPAWDSLTDEQQTRYDDMMAIYAAMVDEVDRNVGKLVEQLRERRVLDDTLILFLSDNGGSAEKGVAGVYEGEQPGDPHSNVFIGQCWAHLNNTPFRKYKSYNHEGGIATPLIAHWPAGIPQRLANEWITTPTHVIDLMATCLDLAEAAYPAERSGVAIKPLQGKSLRPLLTGEGRLQARPLYWEHEGNAALRVGDRKLARRGGGPWELFDLKTDRTEQHNLAADQPEEAAALAAQWRRWAHEANVLPKPPAKKRGRNKKNPAAPAA